MTRAGPARDVVVVTGTGGIGMAVARRLGTGRRLVVGNRSKSTMDVAVERLRNDGYAVDARQLDVGDRGSVAALVEAAGAAGPVRAIVHTGGVSAATGTVSEILRVDLVGCAYVIEEFLAVAGPGTSMVCVSSMAGHLAGLSPEGERHLATAPAERLLDGDAPGLPPPETLDTGAAYILARRANHLRVQAAAPAWGARGARINSLSPGLISTRMGHRELHGPYGPAIRRGVADSPAGRIGTADEVAAVAEFLTGPNATYITGTDLVMDGGGLARLRWPPAS
jgi:NAD(P)-dependent dehydrogenase (short-subunit alcohol dehydrogenase family)